MNPIVTLVVEIVAAAIKLLKEMKVEVTEAELVALASSRAAELARKDSAQVAKEDEIVEGDGS